MAKAFTSCFPQEVELWHFYHYSGWDLAVAWVQQKLFGQSVVEQISAAKREAILCEKSVYK